MKSAIERRFQDKVFGTTIASATKIQQAEATKKSVFQLDRQSTGARDFMSLGREVLHRLGLVPQSEAEVDTEYDGPIPFVSASED